MAIGSVLGSGILVLPAVTAEEAGPASLVSWVLMSLLAFPLAITIGRMASLYPSAGGIVNYARVAFGQRAGTITGWLFMGTVPIGVPIIALVGANYVGAAFHLTRWGIVIVAALLLAMSLLLNVYGIEVSTWVQVLIVCVIAGLLMLAIIAALPHVARTAFQPFVPHGFTAIGTAAVSVFWCYVGWEMMAHLAEEFKNPRRDIFLCLTLAPIVVGVLYIALAVATVGTHAYGKDVGLVPLSALVSIALGHFGVQLTTFLALLITFGGIHMNIAGFSRLIYAQARAGDFPKVFTYLHPRHQSPVTALVGLGLVFACILSLDGIFQPDIGFLIEWPSVVFLVLYMIAMLSALKLLPRFTFSWWMALIPFLVCALLLPFSKWACVYALIFLGFGWFASIRKI